MTINISELINVLYGIDGTLKVTDKNGNIADIKNFTVAFDEDFGVDNLIFNISDLDKQNTDENEKSFIINNKKNNNNTDFETIDVFGNLDNTGI